MAVGELYGVGQVQFTGVSPLTLSQIQSTRLSPGIRNILLAGAGMVDPSFAAAEIIAPSASISSTEIATILTAIGIAGVPFGSGLTYTGADVYLTQFDEGGTRKTGSNHGKLASIKGIAVPRSITATQGGGPAVLNMDLVFVSTDGAVAPLIYSASAALPSAAVASEGFVLGPININGTSLPGIQSFTFDFGLGITLLSGDGEAHPTFAAIQSRGPSIRFSATKSTALTTITMLGTLQGATDSVCYLRKLTEGGTRVANATAQHISFTVDEGRIEPDDSSYDMGGSFQSYVITPTYDGTNAIVVISAATAIS